MKLFRHGPIGAEKPGILDADGARRDLSGVIGDLGPEQLSDTALAQLADLDMSSLPQVSDSARIGPCLANPQRFFCIGLNYSDHAEEAGMAVPEQPILFMKVCAPTGPHDPIHLPRGSEHMDWEVEIGVVIGKAASHVPVEEALGIVAGYCIVNDVSERDFQTAHGGQWVKGKSCDGFGPIGPYLVTADEVPDPQNLDLWLDVNGERQQTGHSGKMVFSVAEIIAHISRFISLRPGDIISTGTPPGVGMGLKPPRYLKAGDEIRLGVADFGMQSQTILPPR